jgi:hypothetical protein
MYSSVQDFMLLHTKYADLCGHTYVHFVTKNGIVAQVQNMVMLVFCIYDKTCREAMSLC